MYYSPIKTPPTTPTASAVSGVPHIFPDTVTGTAMIKVRLGFDNVGICSRLPYSHQSAEDLGCLDAPGKLACGSMINHNGYVLPELVWR